MIKLNIINIIVIFLLLLLAIFLQSDCDLTLLFYSYDTKQFNNNVIWITVSLHSKYTYFAFKTSADLSK